MSIGIGGDVGIGARISVSYSSGKKSPHRMAITKILCSYEMSVVSEKQFESFCC